MALAPVLVTALRVGTMRSMRVASVTLPSATGTFRSTRYKDALALKIEVFKRFETGHWFSPGFDDAMKAARECRTA